MTRCQRLVVLVLVLMTVPLASHAQNAPVGAWEWISTDLPGGGTETPATTGHSLRREFTSPDLYTHFVDGQPVLSGTFTVTKHPGENDWWVLGIVTPSWSQSWIFVLDGSTALHLMTDGGGVLTEPREHYLSVVPVEDETHCWGEVKETYRR